MEGSHNYSNNKKQLGFVLSPEINVDEYISLRLPSTEDAKMLFKSVEENRFYLREWLPWVDSIVSLQDEINFILTSRKNHILSPRSRYHLYKTHGASPWSCIGSPIELL